MKIIFLVGLFSMSSMLFHSCAQVSTPLAGMLYTDVSGPGAIYAKKQGTRKGEACSQAIVGIATGDSSIQTAMKNGKITKVAHIDHTVNSILGVYAKYCTVVYGIDK